MVAGVTDPSTAEGGDVLNVKELLLFETAYAQKFEI